MSEMQNRDLAGCWKIINSLDCWVFQQALRRRWI